MNFQGSQFHREDDRSGFDRTALLLLIPLLVFVAHALIAFPYTCDDAFISCRYAEHLAQGRGLTFNPGDRLEGYSNLLWILFLALGVRLGIAPFLLSKIAGILLGCCSIVLVYALSRKVLISALKDRTVFLTLAPPLLLALDRGFVLWSVGGLETQALTALLLAGWYIYSRELERGRGFLSVIPFILLMVLRPEGILYALPVIAAFSRSILRREREYSPFSLRRPSPLMDLFFWGGTLALAWAIYSSWRISYFNEFIPNVVPAKMSGGFGQLFDGLSYLLRFIRDRTFMVILPVGFYFLLSEWKKGTLVFGMGIESMFILGLFLLAGGDWMRHYRFYVPAYAFWMPLFAGGLWKIGTYASYGFINAFSYNTRVFVRSFFLLALLSVLCMNLFTAYEVELRNFYKDPSDAFERWKRGITSAHPLDDRYEAGLWLRDNLPEDWTLAAGDCGMIPYYSRLSTVDLYGVLDRRIARLKGRIHRKFDLTYFFARNPEVTVLIARVPLSLADRVPEDFTDFGWNALADRMLFESSEFHERYLLRKTIGGKNDVEGDPKFYHVYIRREGP
jgi:hypothetical protein